MHPDANPQQGPTGGARPQLPLRARRLLPPNSHNYFHAQNPLTHHDPARDPGQGSNAAPMPEPPQRLLLPLLPPPSQGPRGRERSRHRARTPTREWTPSRERHMHTVPECRQRIQTDDDRPQNHAMIPYTEQGSIEQRYRTEQTNRWTRAEHWEAIPVNGPHSAQLFIPNILPHMTMQ